MASSAVNGTNSKRTRFLDHIKFVHLFAGVSGGIISTLALHPLDLIKVRFQGIVKLVLFVCMDFVMHILYS